MLRPLFAYRVVLETNRIDEFSIRETHRSTSEKILVKYPCKNRSIIIITDKPEKIYQILGNVLIRSITQLEPGYKL